jgi:hypothetical protein
MPFPNFLPFSEAMFSSPDKKVGNGSLPVTASSPVSAQWFFCTMIYLRNSSFSTMIYLHNNYFVPWLICAMILLCRNHFRAMTEAVFYLLI